MKSVLIPLLSLCFAALPARAVIVSAWTFEGAETGYSASNGSAVNAAAGVLSVTNTTTTTRVNFDFAPVTLASVGDYIEVVFQAQLGTGTWGAATGLFRYMQSVLWNDIGSNSPGYGGWLSTNSGNRNRIYEIGNAGNLPQPSGDVLLDVNDPSFNLGSETANFRDFTLRVERVAGDGVTITYMGEENGGTPHSLSRTDSTGSVFTFNSFDLAGGGSGGLNFNLDNISVSTNVPEPSALLFSGFAAAGLLLRRRR